MTELPTLGGPERPLPWREISATEVELPPAEELVRDTQALTDIHVAPSGATCCLRRVPNRAELLAWDGAPAGPPSPWTEGAKLPLLDLVGFDGREVYGRTQREIVRIRPGQLEVVHRSEHDLGRLALSPDRSGMAWIERAEALRLCTMRLPDRRVVRWPTAGGWCAGAVWLDDDTLLVSEVRTRREIEVAVLLTQLRLSTGARELVVETADWLFARVGPVVGPRAAFLSGHRHRLGGREFRWLPPGDRPIRDATWILSLDEAGPAARCVASDAMGDTSSFAIAATCLFSPSRRQAPRSTLLLAASADGVRAARARDPIGDFAFDRAAGQILYRSFGDRHAIMRLDVTGLVE